MKKFLFLAIAFFTFQFVDAQEQLPQSRDTIFNFKDIDVKPEYPGGMKAFYNFIAKNFKTPDEEEISGKIIVSFIIEKDGNISDMVVLQDIGFGSGEKMVKVLKKMDKWIPAQKSGTTVRMLYLLPITINSGR